MTENTRKVLLNALILTFLSGGAFADGIIAKKNFSILGDNKDEILANVLTSTTALVQAEAPPPVVTSTSTVLNSTGTVVSNSTGTINANFGNPFLPPITNPAFKNSAFPVTTNTIQQTVSQPPNQQPPPLVSSNTVSQSSSQLPSQQPNQVVASSQPAQIVLPPMSAARAGDEFVEYLNSKNFLFYSRERWQKMRSGLEREEQEKEEPQVSVSTMPKTTAQLPPGLSVELPYESQLTISGRKTIGFSLKSTIYEHEEAGTRQSTTAFDMTQELQVRIKGQVGRKVNTNVDFDDTNANKRDISVVYKGDKNEVVQDAAFGDITVALPSTEFVGYSKQLFGINLHTKYKGLESWGFFSQTKGLSEMKKFQGLSTTQRKVLNDTDYLPMKYYMAKFNNDVMQTGSLRVYLDDMNPIDNNVTTLTGKPTINVSDYLTPNASSNPSYTGDFDLLVPGQDYNVNYDLGIITIKKQIQPNYVIAVDYLKVGGGSTYSGQLKIVKDTNNTVGLTRELKTFYSLGDVQITRDNGKGNFVLQIQDPNNNNQVPANIINDDGTTKPTPQYSINSNQSNIFVDFDAGIFYFTPPDAQPPPFQNSLYTAVKEHKYTILVQYDHLQTGSIQLGRFDIVPQSEKITLDGVPLAKDKDYIIDYDVGLVTFLNKDRINANTDIEITYDYAPLGTGGGSTLVGTRSQLSLTKDITVGGSFIDNFAAKTTALPDIRSTPSSLMVVL
jgi:hypothetical protein